MRRKIILTTVLLFLLGHSWACSCMGPGTVKEEFKKKELIIYGRVISKELVSPSETIREDMVKDVRSRLKDDKQKLNFFDTDYIFEVKLEVIEKYKGVDIRDTVTIYTAMKSATCGYAFEKDKVYIIYASKRSYMDFMFLAESDRDKNFEKKNTYWTTHCSRTTEYNKLEADELKTLKE